MGEYYIVHKSAVPENLLKVLEAVEGIKAGRFRNVSEATRQLGIARSTFYKYNNRIFPTHSGAGHRRAVVSLRLVNQPRVLAGVLNRIADHTAIVLTMSQAIPVGDVTTVLLSLDITDLQPGLEQLLTQLELVTGVAQVQLVSVG